jgi:thioredoxin reductase (NADPH)
LQHHTLLIIGGGPIGLTCALEAKARGIDYLILEKGTLVNSLYNYPVNMTFFSTSERLEIGGVPFVSNNPKPTRSEALNVPGEGLPKVRHYYKDPNFYAFQDVLVVGSQNSAVDAALETWRKGARVTMVVRGPEIGQRVKYWVKPDIENRIAEGSIKAFFNSVLQEIRENEVVIRTPEGLVTVPNDWVIAMTGYQPNLLFLEKLGIALGDDVVRKPVYDEETHETNQRSIYLAGVICGGMNTHRLFIENSREHAQKIMTAIKAKEAVLR